MNLSELRTLWLTILLAFTFTAFAVAEETEDVDEWTPELSIRYRTVSDTAISPNGRFVAYTVREALTEGEKSEYLTHIWLWDRDTQETIQYTHGDASATSPAFSPDGVRLSFQAKRGDDKHTQVWAMRVRGGEARKLTHAENGVSGYAWSPDGAWIAYRMSDPKTKAEKKAKKEKRDVILVNKHFKFAHLYKQAVGDADAEPVRLTEGDFHVSAFDWSPDSGSIVFSHQADPRINTGFSARNISVVSADGGEIHALVDRPGVDASPMYSPDGKWVAFTSHGGQPEEVGLGDVWVVSADGGTPRKLAHTPDRRASIHTWRQDGKALFISESVRTSRQVIELPIDGEPVVVTEKPGIFGNVSFTPDTKHMAFVYQDTDKPQDVYVSTTSAFAMNKISEIHEDVPRPPMGRTELLTWKSRDGMEIEGLLSYPVGYQAGQKVPLILNIHGGPAGVFNRSFTGAARAYMLQYFMQQGYAILRPNPRGSTGYGKEFRYANFRDWGFGDYEDLMTGVDKVIDMGIADPDQLCVMGWSYGGYMTSMIVTKTNRFKAASMGAGLPNLISMVSTTDIPNYLVAHMGGEFWDDYEGYEKHSAMYSIKNVTTPTQIIHGANDLRVPLSQGQELYNALDRKGVATEMIVYPRTPHGPREPKFVMDVSERILTWFDHHLGRPAKEKPVESEGSEVTESTEEDL